MVDLTNIINEEISKKDNPSEKEKGFINYVAKLVDHNLKLFTYVFKPDEKLSEEDKFRFLYNKALTTINDLVIGALKSKLGKYRKGPMTDLQIKLYWVQNNFDIEKWGIRLTDWGAKIYNEYAFSHGIEPRGAHIVRMCEQ